MEKFDRIITKYKDKITDIIIVDGNGNDSIVYLYIDAKRSKIHIKDEVNGPCTCGLTILNICQSKIYSIINDMKKLKSVCFVNTYFKSKELHTKVSFIEYIKMYELEQFGTLKDYKIPN